MDVSAAAMAAAAAAAGVSRRSIDAGASASRRSMDASAAAAAAAAAERRRSVDVGPSALWRRSSLYSSSASGKSRHSVEGATATAAVVAGDRRSSMEVASAAQQRHQQELCQCATSARSQPQPRAKYAAASPFAAAAPQAQLVRTNSDGSSGSAGSSSSAYDSSCQQQQMMHMAMQNEVFACRDAYAAAGGPAAAVAAVQQHTHTQPMTALQVIEDEITHLAILGQQLLTAAQAAPQGSAAAAACEAAMFKHGAAMGQAVQAPVLSGVGSMELDLLEPELQGYYQEAADACTAGAATGTDDDDEECYTADGHAAMGHTAQQSSAVSVGSVSMTEASCCYHASGAHEGRVAGVSHEQQQHQMLAQAHQQKMQQLRALQQMSAELLAHDLTA
ncbi:hypothetical protein COO60DRAFT_1636721 [Scenedesmus sp. NREL 46B-D3]|nr:hypothetical protein COO60DRAFT_1636721 [Scenedesmus sp. NREL 46B-D3]